MNGGGQIRDQGKEADNRPPGSGRVLQASDFQVNVMANVESIGTRHRGAPRLLAALGSIFREFRRTLFDSYRPERHYMRGPGPKWRERHGR
ncbi:MAG: hypothetical protein HXY30_08415 [Pseudorhodoplanes sp.]|nr:hypothetical protein [Pseudorhodoplanes sp.]